MSSRKGSNVGLPSGSPKSSKSVLSVSVSLQEEVENILTQLSRPATTAGMPIRVVDKESFRKLSNKLVELINSKETHTVSPIEMSTLNAELASARLQLNLFKDKAEKAEFAEKTLKGDVAKMKHLLEEEQKVHSRQMSDHLVKEENAKAELKKFREESSRLKMELGKARSEKNEGKLKELEQLKDENSKKIQQINNMLQESNKIKSEHRASMTRYQDQLLKLTTELNNAQAQLSTGLTKGSFAAVLKSSGSTAKDLFNDVVNVLSQRSKYFIGNAKKSDPDDVKNKAYWLHVAMDSTHNAIIVPYHNLINDILADLKLVDYHSRKHFAPIVDGVLDTFTGKRDKISAEELTSMLHNLNTSKIRMRKIFREKGILTLDDFIKSGGQMENLGIKDIDLSNASDNGEGQKLKAAIEEKVSEIPVVVEEPPAPPPQSGTVYRWCRRQVTGALAYLTKSSDESKSHRWSVRAVNWLRSKAGFFGSVLAVPLAGLSFITGSFW